MWEERDKQERKKKTKMNKKNAVEKTSRRGFEQVSI